MRMHSWGFGRGHAVVTADVGHPSEEALMGFAEAPGDEGHAAVRKHLVACASCRRQVAAVREVCEAVVAQPLDTPFRRGDVHPSELEIAAYVDGARGGKEEQEIRQHLNTCAACLQAALHYTTHSAAMQEALRERPGHVEESAAPVEPAASSSSVWARRIFAARMPVWIGVPVTAVAAVALILIMQPAFRSPPDVPGLRAAVYQDTPVVTFKAPGGAPPGIGFFGSARERTEPFEGVRAKMEVGGIRLRWPKVANVRTYVVRLYLIAEGDRELVGEAKVQEAEALIPLATPAVGRRYEWRITGQLADETTFISVGGLVVE